MTHLFTSVSHYNFTFQVDFKRLGNALVKIIRKNDIGMLNTKLERMFDLIDMIFKIQDEFGELHETYYTIKGKSDKYFELSELVSPIRMDWHVIDGKFMYLNGSDHQKQKLGDLRHGRVKDFLLRLFQELLNKHDTLTIVIKAKLLEEMATLEKQISDTKNDFAKIEEAISTLSSALSSPQREFLINSMKATYAQALKISEANLRDLDCYKRRVLQQENEMNRFRKFMFQFEKQFSDNSLNVIKYHVSHNTEAELMEHLDESMKPEVSRMLSNVYKIAGDKNVILAEYFAEILKSLPPGIDEKDIRKQFAFTVYGSEQYRPYAKFLFACLDNRVAVENVQKMVLDAITEEELKISSISMQ